MPWEHCGRSMNDDTSRCADCGISKGAWTVKLDQTRLLQIGRVGARDADAQVAVLKSAADQGVPFCEECEKARRAQQANAGGE